MSFASRETRRRLARELRETPAVPPPADLLERLRAEIPAPLAAPAAARSGARRLFSSPGLKLAASLAAVGLGLAWALATFERARPSDSLRDAPRVLRSETAAPPAGESAGGERPIDPSPTPPRVRFGADPRDGQPPAAAASTLAREIDATAAAEPARRQEAGGRAAREVAAQPKVSAPAGGAGAPRESALAAAPAAPPASAEGEVSSSERARLAANEASPAREEAQAAAKRLEAAEEPVVLFDVPATGQPSPSVDEARAAANAAPRAPVDASSRAAALSHARDRDRKDAARRHEPPSTGGTAEPLERPYGDMFFRPVGTNPFVDTAEDALSTFALDVDTGSYTLARSYLERGHLPPAEAIRVEEFVNAQRYDDAAPRRGDFALIAEGAPSPFAASERYRLLRFAVKARDLDRRERASAMLTFVIDTSGSMDRENRLGLVKRALDLLLDELRGDDRVALVVYGSRGRVLLSHTRDHEAIRAAIAELVPEGSTNAEEGLRLGYDLASEAFRPGAINRVILCSDGVANVGATGPESILARIGREARRGIELTTVGFGMGNYNDALMEQLADQGDGRYHYVDGLDEARQVFVENLEGTLATVAKDAKVQVEFDAETVERWRLLGYENRAVADRDFRNDHVDAGELGAGHQATALYEVRLAPGASSRDRLATLRLRWQSAETRRVAEAEQTLRVGDLAGRFPRASRDLRLAALAAELAERLKGSTWAQEGSWRELAAAARDLAGDFPRDTAVRDLAELIARAARLAPASPRGDGPAGREDDPS